MPAWGLRARIQTNSPPAANLERQRRSGSDRLHFSGHLGNSKYDTLTSPGPVPGLRNRSLENLCQLLATSRGPHKAKEDALNLH